MFLTACVLGLLWINICSGLDLSALSNVGPHPRMILTNDRIKELQQLNHTDRNFSNQLSYIKQYADQQLQSPFSYAPSKFFGAEQEPLLAVASIYLMTGESKYSDYVIEALLKLASYTDWNANVSFLNTGDTTFAVAIAYDWVYNAMNDSSRTAVADAMINYAIKPALGLIPGVSNSWAVDTNNWAQACHPPLLVTAVAIADYNLTLAQQQVEFSVPRLQKSIIGYGPDGGWYEGSHYGSYASSFFVNSLALIESGCGTDWGLGDTPGVSDIGVWKANMLASNYQMFGWGDGNQDYVNGSMWWYDVGYLDKRFNKSGTYAAVLSRFERKDLVYSYYLWYYDTSIVNAPYELLPRKVDLEGIQVSTYRQSWDRSTDGWYVALRAGKNGVSHGYLNAGGFAAVKNGFSWATNRGPQNYSLPGYFSNKLRYTYYCTQTQGGNTLSIDTAFQEPLQFLNQVVSANNTLIHSGEFDERSYFAIANLTASYNKSASVLRGLALVDGDQFVLRDEVIAPTPVDIVTSWHTFAQVNVTSGQKRAILFDGDKTTMWLDLVSPSDGVFEIIPDNPCAGQSACKQDINSGITDIAVRLPSLRTNATIQVVLHEAPSHVTPFDLDLDNWFSKCKSNCYTNTFDVNNDPYLDGVQKYYY